MPIRGGRDHAPSSLLVRVALGDDGVREAEVVRAAVAAVFALAERARRAAGGDRLWWEAPVRLEPGAVASEMGVLISEAEAGIRLLSAHGVLGEVEPGVFRLDPDVVCPQPVAAAIDWTLVRRRLERAGGRFAAALAILREIGRLSGSGGAGEAAVAVRLADLAEATLYSRATVSPAVSLLRESGLLDELAPANRQGLHLAIAAAVLGREGTAEAPAGPRAAAGAGGDAGLLVSLAGVEVEVLPGGRFTVGPGFTARPELAPDGRVVLRVEAAP